MFVLAKRGVEKAGCEELKEELLVLEDEYEALHHKQALTFDKQNRGIFRGSRVRKKTGLFGLYTGRNLTQYKKDYKIPYNQGHRTVTNQDFMVDVTEVFSFPKCTGPLGLECWIANTLENWNSWTPLSQTLFEWVLPCSQGGHTFLGESYYVGDKGIF